MKLIEFFKRPFSRKTKITLVFLLIIFGGLFAYGVWKFPIEPKSEENIFQTEKSFVECPLNGAETSQEKAQRRSFGIMIENHSQARPQASLNKADLVYEVVTEGGITRFLAFYQCQDADVIGPVRSTRIYYLDWVAELASFYVHAGGAPDALARIYEDKVLDLNHAQEYFWRSTDRYAPHNLYTSIEKLSQYAQKKNYDLKKTDFETWTFKDDPAMTQRPENFSFKINFSSYNYLVEYIYNQQTNDWTRKVAGKVDKDALTAESIQVKNVVVQYTQIQQRASDRRVDVTVVGSGQALFFIDGQAKEGTWEKDKPESRTHYLDSEGQEIKFSRGPIWIEVVQIGTKIEY